MHWVVSVSENPYLSQILGEWKTVSRGTCFSATADKLFWLHTFMLYQGEQSDCSLAIIQIIAYASIATAEDDFILQSVNHSTNFFV